VSISVVKEATTALVQPELKNLDADAPLPKLVGEIEREVFKLCRNSHNYRSRGYPYKWSVIQRTDPAKPVFEVDRIEKDGRIVTSCLLRFNEALTAWTDSNAPVIFQQARRNVLHARRKNEVAKIVAETVIAGRDQSERISLAEKLSKAECESSRLKSERADLADKLAKAQHENVRLQAILATARRRWGDVIRLAQEALPADANVGAKAS
jgi:hypothetical protein